LVLHLPSNHVLLYDDVPKSPEQQAAERADRDAFLTAAREAARWDKIDEHAIQKAWNQRRLAREGR
jgi:hypothetical protein